MAQQTSKMFPVKWWELTVFEFRPTNFKINNIDKFLTVRRITKLPATLMFHINQWFQDVEVLPIAKHLTWNNASIDEDCRKMEA